MPGVVPGHQPFWWDAQRFHEQVPLYFDLLLAVEEDQINDAKRKHTTYLVCGGPVVYP